MPAANVIDVEALPQRESSQIKRNWGSVAREVRETGRVAVTTHKRIEMVILSAGEYSSLMRRVAEAETRQQAVLDQLSARFDERLASLQAPDAAGKVNDLFTAKGRAGVRPKAGTF
jgi:PHD/YefM family antitoxin component YafN of YafNO toxin-antitoxin module